MIAELRAEVSADHMMRHLEEFSRRMKLSGTPAELESFRYLQACLEDYGYRTDLISHDAYISLPGRASLLVGAEALDCITHSFSRPSADGGTRGTLIYAGYGTLSDFSKIDARGNIVLLEAIANPAASLNASQAGAIGQIHISPHEHLHEMCISPVWGSPDETTLDRLPRAVVVSVRKDAGEALKARVVDGEAVEAVLHAEVDTGWRKTPLLVADLMPQDAPEGAPFVMFSGHHDTWYFGVMDNGGANATMLECARLFSRRREEWRRGLRLCFWSGHSHGRYSGSAWYAETHWHELDRRCVAHVNVDSTGARGNTVMSDALAATELQDLAREAVREESGQELAGLRMSRAGDQSFWGIGIPSLFMGMGEQPVGTGVNVMGGVLGHSTRKGAGFGWWWHTPDDTLDKMDPDLLVRDTRVYVHAIGRLLTDRVLPLRYDAAAGSFIAELSRLSGALEGRFDLAPLITRANLLREGVASLLADDAGAEKKNRALVAVARAMVPMDYTTGNRFGQDPALGQAAFPVLDPIRRLAEAQAGSDAALFAEVSARRARNQIQSALDAALAAVTMDQASTKPS